MKKLFYLAVVIVTLSSCKKEDVAPTIATETPVPTTYSMGIKYVTSTYTNFDLAYSLNQGKDDAWAKNSTIKLTYIPGDSIHYELITDAPLKHKSETMAYSYSVQDVSGHMYVFEDYRLSVKVIMYPDGKKYGSLTYFSGVDEQYSMTNVLAD